MAITPASSFTAASLPHNADASKGDSQPNSYALGHRKVVPLTASQVRRNEEVGDYDWSDIATPLVGLVMTIFALYKITK